MKKPLRLHLILLVAFIGCLPSIPASADLRSGSKPNIVVILTDDQGWGDLSLHGNLNLSTPKIDSLARNGAQFDRFYVSPVCSPTRSEFLTGRYHGRLGVRNVTSGGERLNLDEKTIADHFKSAGYRTGAFGKWHNGSQYPYHPLGRGFQEYYGFTSGHWGDYFSPPLEHNGEIVKGQGFLPDDITSCAISFMEKHRDFPFFCYIALNTPHSPMQVPDAYYNRFKDRELKSVYHGQEKEDVAFTRAAMAMCENIDDNIGRVLHTLKTLNLENETIVVYFHDNGPNAFRYNGGMKGRKSSTDEGGVRSPLFIRWPGKIQKETKISRISAAIDILPTLAALADVKTTGSKPFDGVSFADALLKKGPEPGPRLIFSHWAGKVSARSQTHRLDDKNQLYNMITDPGQTTNIAGQQPEILNQLQSALEIWRADVLAGIKGKDNRPFPVGYTELPIAHLPARDARFSGSIRRSALAPNCSFLTNWKNETDEITWPVEIHTAGSYEMTFHHTITEENLGVEIVLTWNDQPISSFKLNQAFNPPLRGQENDRAPRGSESLVKDFLPLLVKDLSLPQGRGTLKFQAKGIKNGKAADLRGISLRLLPK